MKTLTAIALVIAFAAPATREANIAYFRNLRQLQNVTPNQQNHFVIDSAVWQHARSDLADLRLYASEQEVPYALTVQSGSEAGGQIAARLLNAGRVQGRTQFVLDMRGLAEYNEVKLQLAKDATNFIAHARVEGLDAANQRGGVDLGSATLFDFSRENLGANSTIRLLRPALFPYLRITLPEIAPEQVLGAWVADTRKRPSDWTHIAVAPAIEQRGHTTVINWAVPDRVPIARVLVSIDSRQVNFRRAVEVQNAAGQTVARGDVSRIHLVRNGRPVDAECLSLEFPEVQSGSLRLTVDNGNDPPLAIADAQIFARERRVYFDANGGATFTLYYGDDPLSAPVYDYAKLFRAADHAAVAGLGPELSNPAYRGRPDERPWTERHPALLWTALALAVLGLGALALRGLRSGAKA